MLLEPYVFYFESVNMSFYAPILAWKYEKWKTVIDLCFCGDFMFGFAAAGDVMFSSWSSFPMYVLNFTFLPGNHCEIFILYRLV